MKLQIMVELPPPPDVTSKAAPAMPVEDKVRDALELIDSGYDSRVEWLMINKLYKQLQSMPSNPRVAALKQMIEPILAKYGYHGISSETK